MGNEESVPSSGRAYMEELTLFKENKIIAIDPRDVRKEWKQTNHSFFFFVDSTIADRRETLRTVILAAGNQYFYNDHSSNTKIEFLLDRITHEVLFLFFFVLLLFDISSDII